MRGRWGVCGEALLQEAHDGGCVTIEVSSRMCGVPCACIPVIEATL